MCMAQNAIDKNPNFNPNVLKKLSFIISAKKKKKKNEAFMILH